MEIHETQVNGKFYCYVFENLYFKTSNLLFVGNPFLSFLGINCLDFHFYKFNSGFGVNVNPLIYFNFKLIFQLFLELSFIVKYELPFI